MDDQRTNTFLLKIHCYWQTWSTSVVLRKMPSVVLIEYKDNFQLQCLAFPLYSTGPFLFRLVSLSGGNCLIWRLLRISDSGSEIRVSVQPSDTLSHCKWKLCEMCLSQKHIPHKSSRSISRDTCSDESWSQWEWESVYTAWLYLKDCVQFFQSWLIIQYGTGKSFLCSLDNCPLFWPVWCWEDCQVRCPQWCTIPAAEQYRESMSGKVVTLHWIIFIRVGERGRVGR